MDVALAWTRAAARTIRSIALLATVFWTLAFVPYAFVNPVIQPIVVALIAVPLHGIAFLSAMAEEEEAAATR